MIADGLNRFCRSADIRPAAQQIVMDEKSDFKHPPRQGPRLEAGRGCPRFPIAGSCGSPMPDEDEAPLLYVAVTPAQRVLDLSELRAFQVRR